MRPAGVAYELQDVIFMYFKNMEWFINFGPKYVSTSWRRDRLIQIYTLRSERRTELICHLFVRPSVM